MTHISACGVFASISYGPVNHDFQPFFVFDMRHCAAYLLLGVTITAMNQAVKIADIVEAFEFQDASSTSYVNIRTGEVEVLSEEFVNFPEVEAEDEDLPEWLKSEYERCRRVTSSEDFIELPSQYEINEYQIMRSFADDRDYPTESEKLLVSLTGKGAFRRFKDTAFDLGVIDDWHRYRRSAFADIAREWCTENAIEFEAGDA